jgi:hypothetical protein
LRLRKLRVKSVPLGEDTVFATSGSSSAMATSLSHGAKEEKENQQPVGGVGRARHALGRRGRADQQPVRQGL